MIEGLKKFDGRKVALIGVTINGAFIAFLAKAAAAIEREERERNRVRWTDKNRWE